MKLFTSFFLVALTSLSSASIYRPDWLFGTNFGVPGTNATYDYVVIGGGTAGLTIATRLAENGTFSVAVIEAGSFYELSNGNYSQIPAKDPESESDAVPLVGVNLLIDWGFITTAQAGENGKRQHYARGKCLGGSSARNALIYQRPTVGAMQKWADEVDDQSWTWENVLPFYRKSSHFTPPNNHLRLANATPEYDASVFGNGPLQVSFPNYATPIASWIEKAFTALGQPLNPLGFASGALIGHGWLPNSLNPWDQTRSSAQTAYLTLALESTTLTVYTQALAKKIMFETNKTATGVSVETAGMLYNLTATKEVIVSAGAFQSPQMLMVSGIGSKDVLEKYGINVVVERPGVGQNMWDNPLFGPSWPVNVNTSSTLSLPANQPKAIAEYLVNKTGYLTSLGADVVSFEKLSNISSLNVSASARQSLAIFPADWPEVQLLSRNSYIGNQNGSQPDHRNYASIDIGIIAPLSRGNVSIASADSAVAPIINPAWLTHPADQQIAVAAVRRARQIFNTAIMQNVTIGPEEYPGAEVQTYDEILSYVKGQASTFYHAAATCKMGMANDSMAVVDSKGRVFGVQGLRVADVSAMPFLPPGQPQSTVYMLGEKIASDILSGN